jgi:HU domain fused to wHTH, Ig, or Glycine-rich motif
MRIRYRIVGNSLQPGTFAARVVQGQRVGLDTMIANIVRRTSLSPADVHGAVMMLIEEVRDALVSGDTAIIDGLATFNVSLSGAFTTPDTTISRDSAQLNVVVQGDGRLLSSVAASASYERMVLDVKAPIVSSFFNVATASFDGYTPGSIVRLLGDNLKFDPVKGDEGVFMHGEADETRLTVYSTVGTRQVDALIPPTVSGVQQVVVRTRYTPNGELREGRMPSMVSQM